MYCRGIPITTQRQTNRISMLFSFPQRGSSFLASLQCFCATIFLFFLSNLTSSRISMLPALKIELRKSLAEHCCCPCASQVPGVYFVLAYVYLISKARAAIELSFLVCLDWRRLSCEFSGHRILYILSGQGVPECSTVSAYEYAVAVVRACAYCGAKSWYIRHFCVSKEFQINRPRS